MTRPARSRKRTDQVYVLASDWPTLDWVRSQGGQIRIAFLEYKRAVSVCRLLRAGLVVVRADRYDGFYSLAPNIDAYCEGRRARQAGISSHGNPYRAWDQADAWDDGYRMRVHNLTIDDD